MTIGADLTAAAAELRAAEREQIRVNIVTIFELLKEHAEAAHRQGLAEIPALRHRGETGSAFFEGDTGRPYIASPSHCDHDLYQVFEIWLRANDLDLRALDVFSLKLRPTTWPAPRPKSFWARLFG